MDNVLVHFLRSCLFPKDSYVVSEIAVTSAPVSVLNLRSLPCETTSTVHVLVPSLPRVPRNTGPAGCTSSSKPGADLERQ